ncbi:MAG: DUF1684 domain-containing protein [Candidatus Limnocylindrales bacterium]
MQVPGIDHEWRIAHSRAVTDDWFRVSPHSPTLAHDRPTFGGLSYDAGDPGLRFDGFRPGPIPDGTSATFRTVTSAAGSRQARRIGTLAFRIGGASRALVAYEIGTHDGSRFVSFQDAAIGVETYGAGRYVDIELEEGGTYIVDFNAADHPVCAYAPDSSCPLTPAANRLPDRIEAGERLATADVR